MIDEVEIFNAVLSPGSVALLAGGRYGIATLNDSAVSVPPLPVVPPTAKAELRRAWAEYQATLTKTLQGDQDAYLKNLEKLEADAMRDQDTIGAAATRKERGSKDPGLAVLAIPEKATSPALTELRRLRTDFERKRREAIRTLNSSCRAQLELIERGFIERNEPLFAATIRIECDALAKPPLEVMSASYGADDRMIDVTLPLRKAIRFNRIDVLSGNNLAGDPAPQKPKSSSVTYRLENGQEKTVHFDELATIKIP